MVLYYQIVINFAKRKFKIPKKTNINYSSKRDVIFTGHLENPLYIIKQCCLFVMPSFHEGLSNQLLEAIYTGIPILATKCQGNTFVYRELLKENSDYINSKFLKLMPIITNKKIMLTWIEELIFYSSNFKNLKYGQSQKLINLFSTEENFIKWENMVRKILK